MDILQPDSENINDPQYESLGLSKETREFFKDLFKDVKVNVGIVEVEGIVQKT